MLFIASVLYNSGAAEGTVNRLRGFRGLLISGGLDRSNRDLSNEQGSPPSYINTTRQHITRKQGMSQPGKAGQPN